jgi:hypothetical protein
VAKLITVSELVDRAAPPSEDRRRVWLRRARLWSVANILPTATAQGAARRHRLYSENTIFLAAILFRISDLGATTDILHAVSEDIQWVDKHKGRPGKVWRLIKRRIIKREGYLRIRYNYKGRPEILNDIDEHGLSHLGMYDDTPAIFLNLTAVLEELSAVAGEEGK